MTLPPRLEVRGGLASEIGSRAENEDFAEFVSPAEPARRKRGVLALVADGIGGAPAGRDAAEIAVGAFIDGFYAAPEGTPAREAALLAMAMANRIVIEAASADSRLRGMGTTLSALALHGGESVVAHVGDSRIYRLRGRELERLTDDHNLRREGFPNILTRSLGAREDSSPDCRSDPLLPGDRFLLCTDGVTGALPDAEISHILASEADPGKAARRIAAKAVAAGAADNATALVVDVVARAVA